MKNITRKIISIFAILYTSFTFNSPTVTAKNQAPSPSKIQFTLVRVSDGDTIKVSDRYGNKSTIRFACIDAAEIAHSDEERESTNPSDVDQFSWGNKAKSYVQSLIKPGDPVYLTLSPNGDRYDRTVAEVHTRDGIFIQQSLIKKGLAVPYFLDNCPSSAAIAAAASSAKASKAGFYSDSDFVLPQSFRHQISR